MSLGEKLREARLAAGLSQRQLCGEEITRNMLSQIEHGTATPSMATLRFLAERLEKPVSFFLEEDSPENDVLRQAWDAFESGNAAEAYQRLDSIKDPALTSGREYRFLLQIVCLQFAQRCILTGKQIYARQLLSKAAELETAWLPELRARRVILQSKAGESIHPDEIPNPDAVLLLHAAAALRAEQTVRAAEILDAAIDKEDANWCLLRGRTAMAQREYGTAAKFLQQAERGLPEQTIPLLEHCFRELGDFRTAYYYATKARDLV